MNIRHLTTYMTQRTSLQLGLIGFGCVGQGLYDVLQRTPGIKATIRHICVKQRGKPRALPADRFVHDPRIILDDPEVNVVVELIDDADAAFTIVREALQRGKAVVTANKKMLAEHLQELLALQAAHGTPLLYEAACCASIPIIRNLEEYYDNDLLGSIAGIVNGSTNYILTRTATAGIGYAEALREAQAHGYAESDPTLDTGGSDATYKLTLLLAHAFGVVVPPDAIFHQGIDALNDLQLRYAKEKGLKVKLVAQAFKRADGGLCAFVLPTLVGPTHRLYHVDDVLNGVITRTCFADTQFFQGKGAGAHPTAGAVLSDLSALSYGYRYEYKKLHQGTAPALDQRVLLDVLLTHAPAVKDRVHGAFDTVVETYANGAEGYVSGHIRLDRLRRLRQEVEGISFLLRDVPEAAVLNV